MSATSDMHSATFLDVVVSKRAPIFELLASEDQTLLIRSDSFLVLNPLLDSLDGIDRVDIQGDGLTGQGLDEDLLQEKAIKIAKRSITLT